MPTINQADLPNSRIAYEAATWHQLDVEWEAATTVEDTADIDRQVFGDQHRRLVSALYEQSQPES